MRKLEAVIDPFVFSLHITVIDLGLKSSSSSVTALVVSVSLFYDKSVKYYTALLCKANSCKCLLFI